MWMATKAGFFSVVEHFDDPEILLVRGRVREDMDQLAALAATLGIEGLELNDTAGSDYRFRYFMKRSAWEAIAAALVSGIDYSNFKDKVHGDQDRDRAYLSMWSAMNGLQREKKNAEFWDGLTEKQKERQMQLDREAAVNRGLGFSEVDTDEYKHTWLPRPAGSLDDDPTIAAIDEAAALNDEVPLVTCSACDQTLPEDEAHESPGGYLFCEDCFNWRGFTDGRDY